MNSSSFVVNLCCDWHWVAPVKVAELLFYNEMIGQNAILILKQGFRLRPEAGRNFRSFDL